MSMNECYVMKVLKKSKNKKKIRKSAHLEAMMEYKRMLCDETLHES